MTRSSTDHDSGSADIGLAFLAELESWLATETSGSAPALRSSLLRRLREAQAEQPSMALIHQLAARALQVADAGAAREEKAPEVRSQLARSCEAERADLIAAGEAVARTAVELLDRREPWIATLSNSRTVRDALRRARESGREPRALVAEGRPRLEGRRLAAALAAEGLPVWLVADAALPLFLSQAHALWMGADAVTDRGVINKIGAYPAALAAREHSVPVYALAVRKKFLPAGTPALKIVEMPPEEVWEEPAPGVRPRNLYFEVVPLELLRGVAVEDGVLGPAEAAIVARERPLPEELAGG